MTPTQIEMFKKDLHIGRLEGTLQAVLTMVARTQSSCRDVRAEKSLHKDAHDTAVCVLQDCAVIQEIIQTGLAYKEIK